MLSHNFKIVNLTKKCELQKLYLKLQNIVHMLK